MNVELINTGSELMLGRVLNTHQQWLCRRLADMGYVVNRQVAVADTGEAIQQAVREALARADLVVTTGGLGPTSDDLTRSLLAELLGKKLRIDEAVLGHIKGIFERRNRPLPPGVEVQAQLPEGALVLPNPNGTAPGLALEVYPNPYRGGGKSSWIILLPGPPRELRPMFVDAVVPLLARVLPPAKPFHCLTLRTTGIGESVVEDKVNKPLHALVKDGLELGYCARPGQVDIRLAAVGDEGERTVREAEKIVRDRLGIHIYGQDDEELENVLVHMLSEREATLAVAESCTGGLMAHRLTNVPGASAVLLAGLVTYSNAAKRKFLGVTATTLAERGAVSEAVARAMAEGARRRTGADYTLAVTGIAGPSGGTPAKPVGTVFLGLAGPFETVALHQYNPYDRETFKQVTVQQALDLLRRALLQKKKPAG